MTHGSILNLCDSGGSGMSTCRLSGKDFEQQKSNCDFCNGKSTGGNYCINLTFKRYCSRLAAQKHSLGQPVNLNEVNGYQEKKESIFDIHRKWKELDELVLLEDNSGTISGEALKEIVEEVEKITDADQEIKEVVIKGDCFHDEHYYSQKQILKRENEEYKDLVKKISEYIKAEERDFDLAMEHARLHDRMRGMKYRGAVKYKGYIKFSDDSYSNSSNSDETIYYVNSRKLTRSEIMERYQEGLIIVVSSDRTGIQNSEYEKLLYDTEYFIFYTPVGDLAIYETLAFLHRKVYMWRTLVPKDALPKYIDFGYHRPVGHNFDQIVWKSRKEKFPKKPICTNCSLGWKYCKYPCQNYSTS